MKLVTILYILISVVAASTAIYFLFLDIVYGELTTGDIAQFTEEQRYTYNTIGYQISLLQNIENNSTLTNKEIQSQIMEYFIVNGLSYCSIWKDNQYGGYCIDPNDKSWYNNLVKKEYIEIIKRNQPRPFDGLAKFFGFK